MATTTKSTTKPVRRFNAIDLGNGKVITPIRDEFGEMEYEASYNGLVIATEGSEWEAREKLNEYVYDLERGRIPEPAPEPTPAPVSVPVLELASEPESSCLTINEQTYILPTVDGIPVRAVSDRVGLLYVSARSLHWCVTADPNGTVWIDISNTHQIELTPDQLTILREVLQTGAVVDRLMGYAQTVDTSLQASRKAAA